VQDGHLLAKGPDFDGEVSAALEEDADSGDQREDESDPAGSKASAKSMNYDFAAETKRVITHSFIFRLFCPATAASW
jgi:hypothetical protein